jgi:hypothetical protein
MKMAPNAMMEQDGHAATLKNSDVNHNPAWSYKEQPIWSDAAAAESMRVGCCGRVDGDLVPPWMDWVESGIEFFGCDESSGNGKNVIGRALMLSYEARREASETIEEEKDFAELHDQFIEALLFEQMKPSSEETSSCSSTTDLERGDSFCSYSSEISSASSMTADLTTDSLSSLKTHKRRRPGPLNMPHKSSPARHARVAPIEAYNRRYGKKSSDTLNFADIEAKEHPDPASMVHPDCRLQKDKGRGEPMGHAISAEGQEGCLEKLRQKMKLLVEVALGEDTKGPTGMKKRQAKVSEETAEYTETRAMIELRLGFLSMQYGILLRWDSRSGKIVFMVLRKMCHDSFYSKIPDHVSPKRSTTTKNVTWTELEPPPLVIRNIIGNHAIYLRRLGTEVVLVDPPYRMPQPEVFAPSVLSVEINNAAGLSRKSRWTISLTFDGHTEVTQLQWNADKNTFVPKRIDCMEWEMSPVTSFDLAGLEIRLFEQQKRRKVHSRLAATMTMPLGGLVAQPSTAEATSWQLTIPCTHDPKANLTLSLVHRSDYSHWLYKELDARRREEVKGFVWRAPFRRVVKPAKDIDDDEDLWDWLCGSCFD